MSYDNVILQTGNFGPYQRRIFLVLFLPAISWAFHKMGGVFLAAKPDFRCLLPHEIAENASYHLPLDITNSTYLWDNKTGNWPQCEKYEPVLTDPYNNVSTENSSSTFSMAKCDSFVYDRTQYTHTAITEWDLVCDDEWIKILGDSLFMLADLPGGFLFGGLSDKYGRKLVLLSGLVIQFVCGLLVAVSPKFIAFTIFRILVGTTVSGIFLVAYVHAIEMVTPKNRMAAGTSINLAYVTGYILIAGLAYFIPNWRTLQIAYTIPSLAFIVLSRFIPESARWLLTKGRVQEAEAIIHKTALENGCELSRDTFDSLLKNSESKPVLEKTSMFDILRYPNLRKRSLLLFFLWFLTGLTYYGLSWNTSNLGGNDYLNFLIAASVEVPAQIFVLFTLNRWGRKIILCSSMCLSGISLLLTFFVPTEMSWLITLLAMIGKSTVSVSYATVYIFTAEQYPTGIRNVGVGACAAFAKLGGVVAPYINYLFEISTYVPLVALGSSSLVSGLSSLLLPETLNKKLPETLREGELFGKSTSETEGQVKQSSDADIVNLSKV